MNRPFGGNYMQTLACKNRAKIKNTSGNDIAIIKSDHKNREKIIIMKVLLIIIKNPSSLPLYFNFRHCRKVFSEKKSSSSRGPYP